MKLKCLIKTLHCAWESELEFVRPLATSPWKIILLLGVCSTALSLQAGWVVSTDSTKIEYSADKAKGFDSIDEALKNLADRSVIQKLNGIIAFSLLSDNTFQAELLAGLERSAPRELREAQKSAGNMHNPKMHQLWPAFSKAFLATPTITKLNTSLAVFGLTISRPEMEKFELRNTLTDPRRRFHGMLWLNVTKLPNKGGAANTLEPGPLLGNVTTSHSSRAVVDLCAL